MRTNERRQKVEDKIIIKKNRKKREKKENRKKGKKGKKKKGGKGGKNPLTPVSGVLAHRLRTLDGFARPPST